MRSPAGPEAPPLAPVPPPGLRSLRPRPCSASSSRAPPLGQRGPLRTAIGCFWRGWSLSAEGGGHGWAHPATQLVLGGIPATRSSLLFPSPPQLCGSPPCVSAGASGTATHSAQGFSVPKATQSATGISVHPGETLIPQVYSPLDSPVYPDSDSVAFLCSSRVSGDFTQQHKASSVFKVVGYSACPFTNSQLLRAKCFLPSQWKETGWGFGSQSQDWSQALLSCGLTLRLHPTPGEIIPNLPPVPTILFPRVQEEHPEFPST